jgi:hypothetical protein
MQTQIKQREKNNEKKITPPAPIKENKREINILNINDALQIKKEKNNMSITDETWFKLQVQALLDGRESLIGPYDNVDGFWKNEPCFVVGSSIGLRHAMDAGFTFDKLNGHHSIGVNHVIEDYHYFEWLVFLDGRFLQLTKWDVLGFYKGRIFTQRRAGLLPSNKVTIFYKSNEDPTENIINGVINGQVSGVIALHLAIISGANPIYMLGMDNGGLKNNKNGNHFKKNYTGESLKKGGWENYLDRIPHTFEKLGKWSSRVYNVDPLGDIKTFRKISWKDVEL